MTIPVMKPKLPPAELILPYLKEMDRSQVYSNFGPLENLLIERYAKLFNVSTSKVMTAANATLGLQLAIQLCDSVDIYCPNWTFPASALSIINSNKKLKLVDININNYEIDLQAIGSTSHESRLPSVVYVLPFGSPIPKGISYESYEFVIIDAAASLGSDLSFLNQLPENVVVIFSLHATKIFGSGEGSIIFCNSSDKIQQMKSASNFGFNNSRETAILGTNAKMSELHAAYANAVFDLRDEEIYEWSHVRESILSFTKDLPIRNFSLDLPNISPYWIIELENKKTKELLKSALEKGGVESRDWWGTGISNMNFFKKNGYTSEEYINTECISNRTVGLPFYRNIELQDIEQIVTILERSL